MASLASFVVLLAATYVAPDVGAFSYLIGEANAQTKPAPTYKPPPPSIAPAPPKATAPAKNIGPAKTAAAADHIAAPPKTGPLRAPTAVRPLSATARAAAQARGAQVSAALSRPKTVAKQGSGGGGSGRPPTQVRTPANNNDPHIKIGRPGDKQKISPNFLPPKNAPRHPPPKEQLPPGHHIVINKSPNYPKGYWVEYKGNQPVDPNTHKPPSNVRKAEARALTHVPLP